MPIPLLAEGFGRGWSSIPYLSTVLKSAVIIGVITLLKLYFGGAKCHAERVMHGKVVLVTVCICPQSHTQASTDEIREAHQALAPPSCKN